MYYPDDDTLVIERSDAVAKATPDDEEPDSSSQAFSSRKYKGYCSGRLNPDLLLCKIFYFTFYGSFGSLYPLLAVYFKQLGLNATYSGILMGVRPFVEFCAAPMWGAVADTWRKAKAILLFSLFSWLVFTEAVAFVRPITSVCVALNSTILVDKPLVVSGNLIQSAGRTDSDTQGGLKDRERRETSDSTHKIIVVHEPKVGVAVSNSSSFEQQIKPATFVIKYMEGDTELIFLSLLFLMILGEFFSSPTITLADSATLGYLGHQRMDLYGRQRMFGSLSWGIFMFVEGLILERTRTTKVECDGQVSAEEENYMVCFGTYAVLIVCAFCVATQFQFKYQPLSEALWKQKHSNPNRSGIKSRGAHGDESEAIQLENVNKTLGKYHDDTRDVSEDESVTEADESEPRYMEVLGLYASVRYGTVLYVVWFAGFGFGFLFTFLYWHLKDLGAPPTLFGVAAIVNHLSEVMGYFFSGWVIRNLGHIPVLCLGLLAYALRLVVVSYLTNPWWVLMVEIFQGVTHALVWAASTSFIGLSTSQKNRSSAQGILQGVYHGLGRGCGAIFGGIIISAYGSTTAFRSIGISYVVTAFVFAIIQYMESDPSDQKEKEDDANYVRDDDPANIEETQLTSPDEGATLLTKAAGGGDANDSDGDDDTNNGIVDGDNNDGTDDVSHDETDRDNDGDAGDIDEDDNE